MSLEDENKPSLARQLHNEGPFYPIWVSMVRLEIRISSRTARSNAIISFVRKPCR
jgi:hypothetical protein